MKIELKTGSEETPPGHANYRRGFADSWEMAVKGNTAEGYQVVIVSPEGDDVYSFHSEKLGEDAVVTIGEAYLAARRAAELEREPDPMGIGDAVDCLREGARIARRGWNGRGMWLELQTPTELSKMTLPYVFMHTAQGDLVPWLCSQTDLLATDWQVLR